MKITIHSGLIKNAVIKAVNYTIANGDKKIKLSTLENACDEISDVESINSFSEKIGGLTLFNDLIFDKVTALSIKRMTAVCKNKNELLSNLRQVICIW